MGPKSVAVLLSAGMGPAPQQVKQPSVARSSHITQRTRSLPRHLMGQWEMTHLWARPPGARGELQALAVRVTWAVNQRMQKL